MDFFVLGKVYEDSMCNLVGEVCCFIDKMLLNFMFVGYILVVLFNVCIVCLWWYLLDICLSNFW